jgi:glucose-1-phosphate adenylyltransferase
VVVPGANGRIASFQEKPKHAVGLPDDPKSIFVSMGNYVFSTRALVEAVRSDAENKDSVHDMGGNIITMLVEAGMASVYDFDLNRVPGTTERDEAYWRDVGTLDSYWEANMDLISVHPVFNLYNREWPIHTGFNSLPPAKFVFDEPDRRGAAYDSIISAGVIVSGGIVRRSVLSPGVSVHSRAIVEDSVRGVQAGPLLRLLQERDLIRITGRSSEPGHPLLYGTTKRFLDHFGLKSLKALPDLKDVLESA